MNASPNNREALYHEIEHSVTPPGLLAYVDDQPVGWTRVGPRDGFPGVYENRRLAQVSGQNDRHGASAVEGYPVDVARLQARRLQRSLPPIAFKARHETEPVTSGIMRSPVSKAPKLPWCFG